MAILPTVIHVYDGTQNWWLSVRDLAPPGSGNWGTPTSIMDASLTPDGGPFAACTAGAAVPDPTTPFGIVGGGVGAKIYYAGNNGTNAPAVISTINIPAADLDMIGSLWNASHGAYTFGGFRWLALQDLLHSVLCMLKGTVTGSGVGESVTWLEQDNGNAPPLFAAVRWNLSNLFDVVYQTDGTALHFAIKTFDFNPKTWSALSNAFTTSAIAAFTSKNGIQRWPNGDFGLVYRVSGNIVYRLIAGGVPGSEIIIATGSDVNIIIDPSQTFLHVVVNTALNPSHGAPVYYTVTHAGVVSGPLFTFPIYSSTDGVNHLGISNGMIFVPYDQKTLTGTDHNQVFVGLLGSNTFSPELLPKPAPAAGSGVTCAFMIGEQSLPGTLALACPIGGGTATIGVPYSATLVASSGTPPYTFSIVAGGLPPGLSLNPSTGVISGTPTTPGTYTYTAEVIDANGLTAQTTCTITIPAPSTLNLLCPTTTTVLQGQAYSFQLNPLGGTPPYTFALVSGALPPGLTLNTSTGVISGTATASGTFTYQVRVTDANGNTITTTCVLTSSQCPGAL